MHAFMTGLRVASTQEAVRVHSTQQELLRLVTCRRFHVMKLQALIVSVHAPINKAIEDDKIPRETSLALACRHKSSITR